jgi:hypothetical protein
MAGAQGPVALLEGIVRLFHLMVSAHTKSRRQV